MNNSYKKSKQVTFSVDGKCFLTNYWKDFFCFQEPISRENNGCLGRVKIEKSTGIFPLSNKNCFVPNFYLALKSSIFYTQPFHPVLLCHELVEAIGIAPNCQNSPILSKNILVGNATFNLCSIDHVIISLG